MGRIELSWNPFDPMDPGPCIDVTVMNSRDVIEDWRAVGLEIPEPVKMRALLDTGASVTAVSKVFANYCKLFQTSDRFEITAIGSPHLCGEHAGAISFPGTNCEHLIPFVLFQLFSRRSAAMPVCLAEISCEIGILLSMGTQTE